MKAESRARGPVLAGVRQGINAGDSIVIWMHVRIAMQSPPRLLSCCEQIPYLAKQLGLLPGVAYDVLEEFLRSRYE